MTRGRWLAVSVLAGVWARVLCADTVSTTARGAWEGAVWTPHAPRAGDVVCQKDDLTLSTATVPLAAFTNRAGTKLTFNTTNAVLNAATVVVHGRVTHNPNSATTTNMFGQWPMDNWVRIVCTSLTVAGDGVIDVNAKGYLGRISNSQSPGLGQAGCGPGGGKGVSYGTWGGGGYGGMGGSSQGGATYGSMEAPCEPGSGGGTYLNGCDQMHCWGGNGGGLVRIDAAGAVNVDGAILANGANGPSNGAGGGGSGGAIWITCRTFAGQQGKLSANGGDNRYRVLASGGGGGGRISIQCDPAAQKRLKPTPAGMRFCAQGGFGYGIGESGAGKPGTVVIPEPMARAAGTGSDEAEVADAPPAPGGEYPCVRLAGPIKLDGRLDDAAWQSAPEQTGFLIAATGTFAFKRQTAFRMGWDDEALYLAFRCMEPEAAALAKDPGARAQENIEVFLMPRFGHYSQTIVGADGKVAMFDRFHLPMNQREQAQNWGIDAVAAIGTNAWTIEVRIPWKTIGQAPREQDVWRGSLVRTVGRHDGREERTTGWCRLRDSSGHDSTQYRPIRFMGTSSPEQARHMEQPLNAPYLADRQQQEETAARKADALARLAGAENLCWTRGARGYPFHFHADGVVNRAALTNDDLVWRRHNGAANPLGTFIEWKKPVEFDTLVVRWYDQNYMSGWYGLEWWDGAHYQPLVDQKDNHDVVCIHTFQPVTTTRLRLTVFEFPPGYYKPLARQVEVYNLGTAAAQPGLFGGEASIGGGGK